MEKDNLGARFWLTILGTILAVCIAGAVFFTILGHLWSTRGMIATLVIGMALVVGIAWVVERVSTRNR
jgi:uncharacterized membrane protein YccC